MPILEENHQIDFEFDFESFGGKCRASEKARENHMYRNRNRTTDVSISNLNVLNFGCFFSITISASASFDSNELELDGFDRSFTSFDGDFTSERFRDQASRRRQKTSDLEVGNRLNHTFFSRVQESSEGEKMELGFLSLTFSLILVRR